MKRRKPSLPLEYRIGSERFLCVRGPSTEALAALLHAEQLGEEGACEVFVQTLRELLPADDLDRFDTVIAERSPGFAELGPIVMLLMDAVIAGAFARVKSG